MQLQTVNGDLLDQDVDVIDTYVVRNFILSQLLLVGTIKQKRKP